MAKKPETYDEQILKEFEESQKGINNEDVKKITKSEDLGQVKFTGTKEVLDNDPNIQRINASIGYINIPLECLPSQGRYYPDDTRISIRAARVGEIREFSTVDENDMKDIIDKLTYMVSQCVNVYFGNVKGSYKDIITADRIVLILKIRELTFVDGASSIKIPVPSGACKTVGCKPQDTIDFNTASLSFVQPDPLMEKYYDATQKCYNVETKNYGVISLYPPNIGVSTAITDWGVKQQRENKKIDASLVDILQFVIKDWRGLSDKMIFSKLTELAGWSTEKFTLVYRIIEKINVGIEFNVKAQCASCGGEIEVPITFPDGYKSLFVPTISDIGDELL
jgi:hypothetical protein